MKKQHSHITQKNSVYALLFLTIVLFQISFAILNDVFGKKSLTEQQNTQNVPENTTILEEMSLEAVMPAFCALPLGNIFVVKEFETFFSAIISIGRVFSRPPVILSYFAQLFEHHIAPQAP